jgi:aspartyl-tRNA synthetase
MQDKIKGMNYQTSKVMGELFTFIFDGIGDRFKHELKLISQQFPFEPIKYLRPSLRITFQEGISMLRVYFFSPFCLSIINTVFIGSWFRCEI